MRFRLLALVAALAMALAACGGGTDDTTDDAGADAPAAEAGAATFVGDDALQWSSAPAEAELVDGSLEVTIECDGAVPHNIVFEGVDDDAIIAECEGNDSGTGTVTVEPGTYTYYCQIPGHREAGMEGEITLS
jgi:plastocyanin